MLSWFRERMIWIRFRRMIAPRRSFRNELWRSLKAEMQPAYAQGSFFAFVRVGVPALIVLLALGGTGAYAYESENVTPEHLLYSVKRVVERVEETAVSLSPQASIAARSRRVAHRLNEAQKLQPGTEVFAQVLADVDKELAQTTGNTPTNASRSIVRKIDENTFGNLETIAQKDPERALSTIEQFIVNDAERIERFLPEQPSETQRQFVTDRLTRRRNALEALNPMAGMIPAPLLPTPVEPNEERPSPTVSSKEPGLPSQTMPTMPRNTEPGILPKGEPSRLVNTPSFVSPTIPGEVMLEPYHPIAPVPSLPTAPVGNMNAPVALPPHEPLPQPVPTAPVNTTQLFPHPESINGVPWSKLVPEVRVRYYREYLLRLQQRTQTQMSPTPITTMNGIQPK